MICMGAVVGYSVCFSLKDCFPSFTSKSWLVNGRATIVVGLVFHSQTTSLLCWWIALIY